MIELRWVHPWVQDDDGSWYQGSKFAPPYLEYRVQRAIYTPPGDPLPWGPWTIVPNYDPPKPSEGRPPGSGSEQRRQTRP
jgi:hypothetical protein